MNINQVPVSVHRIAWEIANGSIPEGMSVLHKCDNKKCIRIDHLFLGTQSDNMVDCYKKKRNPGWTSLTEQEIVSIRVSNASSAELVAKYKISPSSILKIRNGQSFKHIAPNRKALVPRRNQGVMHGRSRLTEADVLAIRASKESDIVLGKQYKMSPGSIWRIRAGKLWKHLL
jgi:hypothetical protein